MKFSLAVAAICGATTTLALPNPEARDVVKTIVPVPFEEAKAKVEEANKKPLIPIPQDLGSETSYPPCGNVRVRREWRLLSGAEQDRYLAAINCLRQKPSSGRYSGSTTRYEDYAWVHSKKVSIVHQTGMFFAWHRLFLHAFNEELRTQCGYNDVIPWFKYDDYAGNFQNAPPFAADKYGSIPTSSNGNPVCMEQTGVFKGMRVHIGPGEGITGGNGRCLSRKLDNGASGQVNINYFNQCRGANAYYTFHQCFEGGPHAYGHIAIGGTGNAGIMSDAAASPGDPLFYLHHAYVDRAWRIWTNDNTGRRLSEIGGPLAGGGTMTLDTVLDMNGLFANHPARDVMDTTNSFLCYKYNI